MNCLLQNIQTNTFYLKIRQFIRFGIVGAINFGVSLGVYYLVLMLYSNFPSGYSSSNQMIFFFFRWDYVVAGTFGFIVSVLCSYVLNRLWVFKNESKELARGSIIRFFMSYIFTSYILSNALNILWVEVLAIPEKYAPIISVLIITPINFLLSKYFSFRSSKKISDV